MIINPILAPTMPVGYKPVGLPEQGMKGMGDLESICFFTA